MSLSFLLGNIIDPTSFAWNCSGNEICFINTDLLIFVCVCVLIAQSYSTLCDLMDCSLADFSVHGISQARILEWVVISFSRGSSQPRDRTHISCIGRWILYHWATREAQVPCTRLLISSSVYLTPHDPHSWSRISIKKLTLKVKWLFQGHTGTQYQTYDLNPDLSCFQRPPSFSLYLLCSLRLLWFLSG